MPPFLNLQSSKMHRHAALKMLLFCAAVLVLEARLVQEEVEILVDFRNNLKNASALPTNDWCSWPGIQCDSTGKHVVSISFEQRYPSLGGRITPRIGELIHLQVLDLALTGLDEHIPASLVNCSELTYVDLSSNKLEGKIPEIFGKMTKLRLLRLHDNRLEGEIPGSLAMCEQLQDLDLSGNNLTGKFPEWIKELHNLSSINIGSNRLFGKLPLLMSSSLYKINMEKNKFSGQIPLTWASLRLQELQLGYNNLEGKIPALNCWDTLDLSNNNLTGGIPSFATSQLTWIDLSNNQLSGPIPQDFPDALQVLDLSHNYFTGGLPPIIYNGSLSLNRLYLSNNRLSGGLPMNWTVGDTGGDELVIDLSSNSFTTFPGFAKCSFLGHLDLSYNLIHSKLSSTLNNCSYMGVLSVSHNRIFGEPNLDGMAALYLLELSQNNFTGQLPRLPIGAQVINLSENEFIGAIPEQICNWTSAVIISLSRNKITGPIPSCLASNLTSLQVLDFSHNLLTGKLPQDIQQLRGFSMNPLDHQENPAPTPSDVYAYSRNGRGIELNLVVNGLRLRYDRFGIFGNSNMTFFDMSQNMLTEQIPKNFGQLNRLMNLNLSNNYFTGTIPTELATIEKLFSLDLSHNSLYGSIPRQLGNLQLSTLDLSFNNLSGPVPTSNHLNTRFPATAFEGNLYLCGSPLQSCTLILSDQPQQEDKRDRSWLSQHVSLWGFYSAGVCAFWLSMLTVLRNELMGQKNFCRPVHCIRGFFL